RGQNLVYLDNAATTQKPSVVIEALNRFYSEENSNVHRGVHLLSEKATEAYEAVRQKACRFLGTEKTQEGIFTRGTTEAIQLVAQSWGRGQVRAGESVWVSRMEHHSNFVPWQVLAREKGAHFQIIELTPDGRIDRDVFKKSLESAPGRPRIV